MLYISRRVSLNSYGVVDSEDGVEEVLSWEDIANVVCDLNIPIEGVEIETKYRQNGKKVTMCGIRVYQNIEHMKTAQAKLHMLYGVEVKTNGDQVVGISWARFERQPDVSIRLSDYGSSCADYLLVDLGRFEFGCLSFITLILDDKIKVSAKSFKRAALLGVNFDIREVTIDKTVNAVYNEFIKDSYATNADINEHISDYMERMRYWKAVCLLNKGSQAMPVASQLFDAVGDPAIVAMELRKRFGSEWESISHCKFALRGKSVSRSTASYIMYLGQNGSTAIAMRDWQRIKGTIMTRLFSALISDSTCNKGVLTRFQNYVTYFMEYDPTIEVKQNFVMFCTRANQFFIDVGKERRWIK